jgi:hypothetical protein
MRHREIFGLRVILATLVLLTALPTLPIAEDAKRDRAVNGEIWRSDPKYYPDSDTYFQLVDDKKTHANGVDWSTAATAASKLTYKGRTGRLAIINSPNLQSWILKNYNFQALDYGGETFIGFRYLCSTLELFTVTGERYPRTAFSFWGIPWNRSDVLCGVSTIPYMSIYIRGETNFWQAAGYLKRFPHYLVEYPPK